MFKSFFAALAIVWVSFFGGHSTTASNQPAAVVAAAPTNQTSPIRAAGTSAPVPSALPAPQLFPTAAPASGQPKNISAAEYANTSGAGQVLGTSTQATYITQEELTAQLQQATNALQSVIYQNDSAPNSLPASGGYTNNIAMSNAIDQLTGTTLNNVSVNGVSGLTAADIPTNIVAANYLPLAGGTLTGTLFVPTLSASSTNYGVLTATNASTTQLSAGLAYFGATATSSFASNGALTLAQALSVGSGGTGLAVAPSYGNILVGNSTGSYALTATSSLGFLTTNVAEGTNLYYTQARTDARVNALKDWNIVNGYLTPTTTLSVIINASSTIGNGNQNGGLTINGGATTTGNSYFANNVGIGNASPTATLDILANTATSALQIIQQGGGPNISLGQAGSTQSPSILFQTQENLAPFNITRGGSNFTYAGSTFFDDVLGYGFNYGGNATKIQPSAALLGFQIESDYWNNNVHAMEFSLNYESPNGTQSTRPLDFGLDRDNGAGPAGYQYWHFGIGDANASEFAVLNKTLTTTLFSVAPSGQTTIGQDLVLTRSDAQPAIQVPNANGLRFILNDSAQHFLFDTSDKITFGTTTDTDLYRSAVHTLTTDGNLTVGGYMTATTFYNSTNATTNSVNLTGLNGGGGGIAVANDRLYFNSADGNTTFELVSGKIRMGTGAGGVPGRIELGSGAIGYNGNSNTSGLWFDSSDNTNLSGNVTVNGVGNSSIAGKLGIGTTNPYSRLQVTGPDAASSTSAFAVVSSASTTVFAVFDGGNAQLSGTLTQSSDQRLKTNIQSLDASDTLTLIDQLNPVTFNWIDPSQGSNTQVGFIAQQVQAIFPELVSTTSATALTPGGTLGLNYIGLISPIVSAIQALYADIQTLEQTVAGFAQSFTSNTITFNNQLCAKESNGTPICITGDQLAALLAAENQSPLVAQPSPTGGTNPPEFVTQNSASTTPPTITINGDNPAIIQVGNSYADLGATVSDTGQGQAGDPNLGLKYFLNGALVSNIVIDTSAVATDTVDYVATDTYGNTATSTRTIMIEPAPAATSTVQ